MPGVRHVRHLADIEALQNRKNILRPGSFGRGFGRRFSAAVHFHFQSVRETVFRSGTVDAAAVSERAKSAYRSAPKSMAARMRTRESWRRVSNSRNLRANSTPN